MHTLEERRTVDIKIGVQDTAREISLESTQSPDDVRALVEAALASGGVLALTDDRGRTVLVPGAKLAYVEIGPTAKGKVGFGASV